MATHRFVRQASALRLMFIVTILTFATLAAPVQAQDAEPLLLPVGVPETVGLPDHVVASQPVIVNQRALRSPVLSLDLFGETVVALRQGVESQRGRFVWIGHLEGHALDTVIVTALGRHYSALIQNGNRVYELGLGPDGRNRLQELMLSQLPPEDFAMGAVPDGYGDSAAEEAAVTAAENVVQDLLVVYNEGACVSAGGCSQLEADIVTAVTAMNAAYAASDIQITMNLVDMAWTDYSGTSTGDALSHLRGTTDGYMDEIHPLRDAVGADIVAMVHSGDGCGIGYLSASASYAFSVTDEVCLVGNRTLSHEIGHNQGAHHDRVTVGSGAVSGNHNYGYRRCNNTSLADYASSPHFRTIMAYSCTSAGRVGRYSHPYVNYSAVPQGVDHTVDPNRGAWNALTLNNSASYIAGFRTPPVTTPPAAPSGLSAVAAGHSAIDLAWTDNAVDETGFTLETSPDGASWSPLASLGANSQSYTHDGLLAESTHYYRVRAYNGAGSSAWSNVTSAVTEALPAEIEDLAFADLFSRGSVSGNYTATHALDGSVQSVTEQGSGGPKKARKQSYDHAWDFNVTGGAGGVVVTVHAWVSGAEGANFWYSTDGGATTVPMFAANDTGPGAGLTFQLPGGTAGPVRIGVNDAEQSNGEGVDTVYVDQVSIVSYTQVSDPPAAPTGLQIDGSTHAWVDLSFTDNADDEWGLEVWRATSDLGVNCRDGLSVGTLSASEGTGGGVSFRDDSVSPETTYWYFATAFNSGGDSACSTGQSVLTGTAPDLSLDSLSAYKVKGSHTVDLAWTAPVGAAVDVRRDGAVVPGLVNLTGSSVTDAIGAKGGGSYSYEVCLTGTTTCSNTLVATF